MPKELQELRAFNSGTVLNASERDIGVETAAFSLNVEPDAEAGILQSIKSNRLVFGLSEFTYFDEGVPHGDFYLSNGKNYNDNKSVIKDISILNDSNSETLTIVGTDGIKENLIASSVEPVMNFVELTGNEGHTGYVNFIPSANVLPSDTKLTYPLKDESWTTDVDASHIEITSFNLQGEAELIVKTADPANLDGEEITFKTPNNKSVTYQFDNDNSGPVTGAAIASTKCCIQLYGLTSQTDISTQISNAMCNTNDAGGSSASLGHQYQLSSSIDTTDASAVVISITSTQLELTEYLSEGSYFSIVTKANQASFNGRSSYELIKVLSVDTDNQEITFTRKAFDTYNPYANWANGTDYSLALPYYLINGEYVKTSNAYVKLYGWSKYSNNHLGDNSSIYNFKISTPGDIVEKAYGRIDITGSLTAVVFLDNTMQFTGTTTSAIYNVGDTITFYRSGASNNGKSYVIAKKEDSKLTFKTNVETETFLDGTLFYELGIIQNPTFTHQSNESGVNVGAGNAYKFNKWWSKNLYWADAVGGDVPALVGNNYVDSTDASTLSVDNLGATQDTTSKLCAGVNMADKMYPYESVTKCAKMISTFKLVHLNVSISSTDLIINSSHLSATTVKWQTTFAKGDILAIDSSGAEDLSGTVEYMLITKVTESGIEVDRGYLDTTAASYTNKSLYKNISSSIGQTISKDKLKGTQKYNLSFYAKTSNNGVGMVCISFNGGYITPQGEWVKYSEDPYNGYISSIADENISQESKWVDIADLKRSYEEQNEVLDTGFRKYEVSFETRKGEIFNTDLTIQFSSRGLNTTDLFIDLVNLKEHNPILVSDNNFQIHSTGFINNKGLKDLVIYDSLATELKVNKDFKEDAKEFNQGFFESSPYAQNSISSSLNKLAYNSNNRELHIGFGAREEDTSPYWLGYLNHSVFGNDESNTLYLDEDTVHLYNEAGGLAFSKMCLAGEFENIDAEFTSDTELRITMPGTAPHRQIVGNNIVVREYEDRANQWEGAGVWVVTETSSDSVLKCKRRIADVGYDKYPVTPTEIAGAANSSNYPLHPRNKKVSFRPYYYYGIRDGDGVVYRVNPDDLITTGLASDATYTKGLVERSLNLGVSIVSCTTCYNHHADGYQGGYIYILSSDATAEGVVDLKVLDVSVGFNEWRTSPLSATNLTIETKPYHWATCFDKSGDLNNNHGVAYGYDVERLNAIERCPTIKYDGFPTDIIETKGPNKDFVKNADSNSPNKFDTRLWIQMSPSSGTTFKEGSRFLFCARTDDETVTQSKRIGAGDRTPPTTLIFAEIRFADALNSFNHRRAWPDWEGHSYSTFNKHFVYEGESHVWAHHFKSVMKFWMIGRGSVDNQTEMHYQRMKGKIAVLGNNVGWVSPDTKFNSGVSISVARHGLIGMADNDNDGVIDGTGVVVPSTTTLNSTTTDSKANLGPYGHEGVRVTSHVVGILGSGNGMHWMRQTGGWAGGGGSDDDGRGNCHLLPGMEPEMITLNNCLFVCADTHWGDIRQGTLDGALSKDNMQGGDLVGTKVWDGLAAAGSRVQFFQSGDNARAAVSGSVMSAIETKLGYATHTDGYLNQFNYWVAGANTGNGYLTTTNTGNDAATGGDAAVDSDSPSDNVEVFSWGHRSTTNIYSNPSWHRHEYWEEGDPSNKEIYTKREVGAGNVITTAPGRYTRSFWTIPTQFFQHGHYSGNPDDDAGYQAPTTGIQHGSTSYIKFYPNIVRIGFVLPKTARVDRLSYRSGYMIRPINQDIEIDLLNCSIESPFYPDAVYHTPVGGTTIPAASGTVTANLGGTQAASEGECGILIDNGSGPGTSPFADQAAAEAAVLGKNIYVGTTFKGVCIAVDQDHSGGTEIRLDRCTGDIANNDVLTTDVPFNSTHEDNLNASKIFMTNPNVNIDTGEAEQTAKLYTFNPSYLTPSYDFTRWGETMDSGYYRGGGETGTNQSLTFSEANTYLYGTIDSYKTDTGALDTGSSGSGGGTLDNYNYHDVCDKYPAVKIAVGDVQGPAGGAVYYGFNRSGFSDDNSTDTWYNGSNIGNDAVWRNGDHSAHAFGTQNRMFGNMLTIVDSVTGAMQTRFIVGSQFCHNSTNRGLYLNVHYPFGHHPANGDKFFIWSHAKACTAELKLDIKEDLTWGTYSLGEVNKAGFASASNNPSEIPINNPSILATYGGLDLRKARTTRITTTSGTDLTPYPASTNTFAEGDVITLESPTGANNDILEVAGSTTKSVIKVPSRASDSTDFQLAKSQQWELFLADKGGDGKTGEVSNFAKPITDNALSGNVPNTGLFLGNLLRATNDGTNLYISGETAPAVALSLGPANGDNDFFKKNTFYKYKISFIYDGYQEGPLSWNYWSHSSGVNTYNRIDVTIRIKTYSKRLTNVVLYRKDDDTSFYRKVKSIPTKGGWTWDSDTDSWTFTVRDNGDVFGTYESLSGVNETVSNIRVKYGLSAEIDGYLFAGDCSHEDIKDASNQLFRSRIGRKSIFDWTSDSIALKSTPTAMVNFNNRLYVFDTSNIYKINQHSLVIEDTYEGIGCLSQESIVITESGMYFADKNGAYMHNGNMPVKISSEISRGGDNDLNWESNNSIIDISWEGLFSAGSLKELKTTFDSNSNSVLFLVTTSVYDKDTTLSNEKSFIWCYSTLNRRWDLWELDDNVTLGRPFIGNDNSVFIPIDDNIWELKKGSNKKYMSWLSKKLNFAQDSIPKVFNKIKINGLNDDLNTNDSSTILSSNRLLIQTSEGSVPSASISYVKKDNDSEYKLKGSNKKGRWVQFFIENVKGSIDSIGIIFRRKTTK
jgi:hypothetical protein